VTKKKKYIPEHSSLLADGNKGGRPDRAGDIAREGKKAAVFFWWLMAAMP
jgi:hypothetical protein